MSVRASASSSALPLGRRKDEESVQRTALESLVSKSAQTLVLLLSVHASASSSALPLGRRKDDEMVQRKGPASAPKSVSKLGTPSENSLENSLENLLGGGSSDNSRLRRRAGGASGVNPASGASPRPRRLRDQYPPNHLPRLWLRCAQNPRARDQCSPRARAERHREHPRPRT